MPLVVEAVAQLPPGSLIGGTYQVLATLGVGGSGTVYRVRAAGKSRQLALKLMNADLPDTQGERARFAREAEMVKRLQHPHIVGLVDYGRHDDGTPYIVQPLLEGETLEDKLAREGALPWALVGKLAVHVLRALEKAHAMGIAHRDIKPPNIFVTTGVLGEVAQVLDFGLAKVVRGEAASHQPAVTAIGAVIGTPRYMAPEQARGEQVGPTADIYSFGLVLAEMLTGHPLVQGKSDIDFYVAQGSDDPHLLPPAILQSPFASIVQRAVAKPLDVRYREAGQMLADTRAVVERLGGGALAPVEADMDATRMIDPSAATPLSLPNETSEKLRSAFNQISKKRRASEPPAPSPAPRPAPAQPAGPSGSPATTPSGTDILDGSDDDIVDPGTEELRTSHANGPADEGEAPPTYRDPNLHEPSLSSFPPSASGPPAAPLAPAAPVASPSAALDPSAAVSPTGPAEPSAAMPATVHDPTLLPPARSPTRRIVLALIILLVVGIAVTASVILLPGSWS